MGMADIAEVLWNHHLRFNPANPAWPDRDRFVLSNGHGSMLLYALLHLTGFDLPMEELKRFRQLHSKTPGHPEHGMTPGVETTTGPLGQGLANAVGMAIAERVLAAEFNRPGFEIVDHHTYVFVGDGCLMEGISHEACSLAGTLGLGKLIAFYDDNGISIDGHVQGWFTDDTPKRFEAYGWHVIPDVDGHSFDAVDDALLAARAVSDRPVPDLLQDRHRQGCAQQGRQPRCARLAAGREGSRRDAREYRLEVSAVRDPGRRLRRAGTHARRARGWRSCGATASPSMRVSTRTLAAEFERRMAGKLPADWHGACPRRWLPGPARRPRPSPRARPRRTPSRRLGPGLPELIGGSADLAASNLTLWSGSRPLRRGEGGNYIFYGVREFGMSAIMNGLVLARRLDPLRRHVPDLLGLCAQRAAHGGADEGWQHLRLHARFHRAGRRRTHPPVDRACRDAAPDSGHGSLAAMRHHRDSAGRWMAAIERRDGPTSLLLSRQNLPFVGAVGPAARTRSVAAGTCSPRLQAARPKSY